MTVKILVLGLLIGAVFGWFANTHSCANATPGEAIEYRCYWWKE